MSILVQFCELARVIEENQTGSVIDIAMGNVDFLDAYLYDIALMENDKQVYRHELVHKELNYQKEDLSVICEQTATVKLFDSKYINKGRSILDSYWY